MNRIQIDNLNVITFGKLIKKARVKGEWYEELGDVPELVKKIKKSELKADLFTFFQNVPDLKPKYPYYMEPQGICAIPVKSYDHWFKKQIKKRTRQTINKSKKMGVEIREVPFDDDFIRGVWDIYNESPLRQGKPFWHYNKSLDLVKMETGTYLDRSDFIGAYYENRLIGFVKLVYGDNFADILAFISKIKTRNMNSANALLAKAIEICERNQKPYLTYGFWGRGGLQDFKKRNGFQKFDVPRYFIPLNYKGSIALKLAMHHGIKTFIPDNLFLHIKNLRHRYYKLKYRVSKSA